MPEVSVLPRVSIDSPRADAAKSRVERAPLPGLSERALRIPLLGKLAGANLLIVLAALLAVVAERRSILPGTAVSILGLALGLSLLVNFALVYVALRPLSDLEATAARVSDGELEARVPPSRLADRDMARVGSTLNTLLDHLTEDRERVRRLAAQVISAQDEERARVARELHDTTAQMLAAVMLQLGVAAKENTSPALDERIGLMRDMVSEAIDEVRSLSHTIHPRVLDDLGLAAALEWIARQTREQELLDVEVFADDGPAIPKLPASVLYRIAQESLRNAVRHSGARRIELWLRRSPTTATLEVVDDGRGFDVRRAEERRPGMGLFSMRERVGLVNGTLALVSAPGQGTRVVATVPLTETTERERR
jgi:signal transduction histidine kinase